MIDRRDGRGTAREVQKRIIRESARKESWLAKLLRKRKEAKGRPKRHTRNKQ
jgi:hypothetical protein